MSLSLSLSSAPPLATLIDAVLTPSMLYGAGTWTLTLEHERQTKRKYKSKKKRDNEEKNGSTKAATMGRPWISEEEQSTSIGHDQDSSVSLENDMDDSTSRADDEEEDCTDILKRSTREAEKQMRTFQYVSCWIETQQKLKLRLAMRIAPHSEERLTKKAAQWKPSLDTEKKQTRTGLI